LCATKISVGIEDRVIRINDKGAVLAYQGLLNELYPGNRQEIGAIIAQIEKIMEYMKFNTG